MESLAHVMDMFTCGNYQQELFWGIYTILKVNLFVDYKVCTHYLSIILCSVLKSGSAVSCIATDDSSSGAFAVAGDCRLQVYLHSQRVSTNQPGNKLFYKIY